MRLAVVSLMYGVRSVFIVMLAPVDLPVSRANSLAAASIWRRLLMQALACEVARAFTKFGIAMAASKPMMATTIIISTNVKPALRMFLYVFIFFCLVTEADSTPNSGYLAYSQVVELAARFDGSKSSEFAKLPQREVRFGINFM